MNEATKSDIHEVHQRIDTMVEHQNQTNVELARIATRLELLPKPPKPPKRPCHFHDELRSEVADHLGSHAETKRLWRTPIVKTVIDVVKLAVVAGLTYLWTKKE